MHCTKYLRRQNATLSTSERHKKHLTTSTGIPDCRKTPENDRKPRISIVRVPTELRRPDHHEMRSEGSATLQISPDFLFSKTRSFVSLLVSLQTSNIASTAGELQLHNYLMMTQLTITISSTFRQWDPL